MKPSPAKAIADRTALGLSGLLPTCIAPPQSYPAKDQEFVMKKIVGHSTKTAATPDKGAMVREHAFNLYRDKRARHGRSSLKDRALAEKAFASSLDSQGLLTG